MAELREIIQEYKNACKYRNLSEDSCKAWLEVEKNIQLFCITASRNDLIQLKDVIPFENVFMICDGIRYEGLDIKFGIE